MDILKLFEDFFTSNAEQSKQEVQNVQPAPVVTNKQPDFLDRLMHAESTGDPAAKAKKSTAVGHHQFTERTWNDLVKKHNKGYTLEDRKDPAKSRDIADLYTAENREYLTKALKRTPTDTELYAAHFLGASGAKKFLLSSPFVKATDVVRKDHVDRNKNVFFDKKTKKPRTVAEVYDVLREKINPK